MAKVTEVQNNQSESNSSSDVNSFVPWNNPDNVITYETSTTIGNIFVCYFNPIIFFIGVPANVINCVVFFRQGSCSCFPSSFAPDQHHSRFPLLFVVIIMLISVLLCFPLFSFMMTDRSDVQTKHALKIMFAELTVKRQHKVFK